MQGFWWKGAIVDKISFNIAAHTRNNKLLCIALQIILSTIYYHFIFVNHCYFIQWLPFCIFGVYVSPFSNSNTKNTARNEGKSDKFSGECLEYVFNEVKQICVNKANLRDLITATGLVILLKLDSNSQFFSPCDLVIWYMISQNNRAPLLYYIKVCFKQELQCGNAQFGSKSTLKNNRAPFLCCFLKLEFQSGNAQFWVNISNFCPAWPSNLTHDLEK